MIHKFGGDWTEEKLAKVRKYLTAYTQIFTTNPKAKFFTTTYLDAFAGTGFREKNKQDDNESMTLFGENDQDSQSLKMGSVSIALETTPEFDRYIFVDNNSKHIKRLEKLIASKYANKMVKISVCCNDANKYITEWCRSTDWNRNRAVAFLDPYGMQVEWSTLIAIAGTRAVDLWILIPLAQGINRLLTRDGPPHVLWRERLTRFYGTEDWLPAFYSPSNQGSLFNQAQEFTKDADFDSIKNFTVDRLKSIFTDVAPSSLALRNSKNIPIFLLCFAAGNPKGAKTAIKIAEHILRS